MKFSFYFLTLTLFISTCTTTKSYEYEIFSEIDLIINSQATTLAYPILFTKNGQILHNSVYHNKINDGNNAILHCELILINNAC